MINRRRGVSLVARRGWGGDIKRNENLLAGEFVHVPAARASSARSAYGNKIFILYFSLSTKKLEKQT